MAPNIDIESRFVNALRTQASNKAKSPFADTLPCPYGHFGRIFQSIDQLLDHVMEEHGAKIEGLNGVEMSAKLSGAARKLRKQDRSHAGGDGTAASDIAGLSLESRKEHQTSPSSGKKCRADSDVHACRENVTFKVVVADPDFSRSIPYMLSSGKPQARPQDYHLYNHKQAISSIDAHKRAQLKLQDTRLYDPKQGAKGIISPSQSSLELSSDRSVGLPGHQVPYRGLTNIIQHPQGQVHQPELIDLQKFDARYSGLLLQPDSHPISQEQLASEVKLIYAGLTMVETKCIHVDRAQAVAAQSNTDTYHKLAPNHWQALIALHRMLLHEHHDFFLASQHPSASPALRRLASKYSMPARMWKHGIYSIIELLQRRLPHSIDYMLAFIYLAYQIMALLYETVPAFENTWIESLGDLGRYRLAIKDEYVRHWETWVGVARSWYSKAADKNPRVGRLYDHLAILARPNAFQQLYYYSRTFISVELFPSARESIITLLEPVLGRAQTTFSHALPIGDNFIQAHACLFKKDSVSNFESVQTEFLGKLDNHISRVTAKWKEEGVFVAITNITAWFEYCVNANDFRQLLQRLTSRSPSDISLDHGTHFGNLSSEIVSSYNRPTQHSYDSRPDTFSTPKSSYRYAEDQTSPSYSYLLFESLCTNFLKFIARARKTIRQNNYRNIRTMFFVTSLQMVSASESTTSSNPTPLLRNTAMFDYVLYGILLPSMALLWYAGARTTELSFVMMLLFACFWLAAVDTSSLFEIRTTILQIWTVFTFNYVARDCVHAIQPQLHVLKYIVLSTLFITLGKTLLPSDDDDKILRVLPLSVALAAVILPFISNNPRSGRLPDIEEGGILRHEVDESVLPPRIPAVEDDRHATIRGNQMPDPAYFDLGSLRSDDDHASVRG